MAFHVRDLSMCRHLVWEVSWNQTSMDMKEEGDTVVDIFSLTGQLL